MSIIMNSFTIRFTMCAMRTDWPFEERWSQLSENTHKSPNKNMRPYNINESICSTLFTLRVYKTKTIQSPLYIRKTRVAKPSFTWTSKSVAHITHETMTWVAACCVVTRGILATTVCSIGRTFVDVWYTTHKWVEEKNQSQIGRSKSH